MLTRLTAPPPDYCRAISYPPPVYKEFSDRRGELQKRRVALAPRAIPRQCMKISSSSLPPFPPRPPSTINVFFYCHCTLCCPAPNPLPAASVTPLLPRISERTPSTHHPLSRNSRNRQSSNINYPKRSPAHHPFSHTATSLRLSSMTA